MNTKMTKEPDMSSMMCWEKLSGCKSLAQWRAKALRLKTDVGRGLYIQYAILRKNGSCVSRNSEDPRAFLQRRPLGLVGVVNAEKTIAASSIALRKPCETDYLAGIWMKWIGISPTHIRPCRLHRPSPGQRRLG